MGIGVVGVAFVAALSIMLNRPQHESHGTVPIDADSGNRPSPLRSTQSKPTVRPLPIQTETSHASPTLAAAIGRVKTRGDYGLVRRALLGMDTRSRYLFLWADLVCVQSPLGVSHDYRESLAIIKEFGGENSASLGDRLARKTGLRLDPAKDKEFVTSLDPDAWKTMIAGVVEANAPKAFELALADWGEPHQRVACAEATRIWLEKDSMAACGRIMKMPKGDMKDVAVSEMVNWLVERNSGDEAAAWISEISDPSLRDEARRRLINRW